MEDTKISTKAILDDITNFSSQSFKIIKYNLIGFRIESISLFLDIVLSDITNL